MDIGLPFRDDEGVEANHHWVRGGPFEGGAVELGDPGCVVFHIGRQEGVHLGKKVGLADGQRQDRADCEVGVVSFYPVGEAADGEIAVGAAVRIEEVNLRPSLGQ